MTNHVAGALRCRCGWSPWWRSWPRWRPLRWRSTWRMPGLAEPLLRCLLGVHYRVKVTGLEHVPRTGPALIVSNHLSWLDGFFVAAYTPRRGKALVSADVVSRPIVRQLAVRSGMIPTPPSGPRTFARRFGWGASAIDRGAGDLPRGPDLAQRHGRTVPAGHGDDASRPRWVVVVPVALDNLWGSVFGASDGCFFRKRPQGWRAHGGDRVRSASASARHGHLGPAGVVEAAVRARAVTGTVAARAGDPRPRLASLGSPRAGPACRIGGRLRRRQRPPARGRARLGGAGGAGCRPPRRCQRRRSLAPPRRARAVSRLSCLAARGGSAPAARQPRRRRVRAARGWGVSGRNLEGTFLVVPRSALRNSSSAIPLSRDDPARVFRCTGVSAAPSGYAGRRPSYPLDPPAARSAGRRGWGPSYF